MFGNAENGFPATKEYFIVMIADTILRREFFAKYPLCYSVVSSHLKWPKKMSLRKTPKPQRFRGFFVLIFQVQIKR